MPELPEVETIASDLKKKIKGKKIARVWYDSPQQIHLELGGARKNLGHHPKSRSVFEKLIVGKSVADVSRRAKNVLIYLSDNHILLVHPKMTGHLLLGKWRLEKGKQKPVSNGAMQEKVNSYIHFLIVFGDGSMMGFSDARKFGKILFGTKRAVMSSRDLSGLGPEPLEDDFTLSVFKNIAANSRGRAKQFLLNQKKIAGIGNIYADESLWASQIHPLRRIESLKAEEIKLLYASIKRILSAAVRLRGTSMSDYRDASGRSGGYMRQIKAYGREGEPCPRCKTKIKRIVIGARSASFCPKCQKINE